MKRATLGFASGIALAAIATPAHADPHNMWTLCTLLPCVYDSHNTLVGIPWPYKLLARQISGVWYQLKIMDYGLIESGLFYFGSLNCTGQPYNADQGNIPRLAQFDGQSIWAPVGNLVSFTWASYSYPALPANGGTCYPYGLCADGQPCPGTGGPAVKIESRAFYPPFRMQ
jgi:hypothetical protein